MDGLGLMCGCFHLRGRVGYFVAVDDATDLKLTGCLPLSTLVYSFSELESLVFSMLLLVVVIVSITSSTLDGGRASFAGSGGGCIIIPNMLVFDVLCSLCRGIVVGDYLDMLVLPTPRPFVCICHDRLFLV